jgi:hypothetical protein
VTGAMASDGSVSEGSKLKLAQLLDMVRTHLATDAGKELQTLSTRSTLLPTSSLLHSSVFNL